MRVLVVDDSPTARRLVRLVLAEVAGVVVVGEAASAEEGLVRADELAPDVVVMDWKMPGMDGAQATAKLLARRPDVRVVGFTSSGDESTRQAFADAGAEAIFAKDQALELRDHLAGVRRPG